MYFPYLRGKQFELIAVRELIERELISGNILPVIEPVKLTSTLKKTMNIAATEEFEIALVINPQVGDVVGKQGQISAFFAENMELDHIVFSVINTRIIRQTIAEFGIQPINREGLLLVHPTTDFANEYIEVFNDTPPRYNLIPSQRTYERKISNNKVIFRDSFAPRDRNADYADQPDEFFSEDHLYFEDEGFLGFSDYCTIGEKYAAKGFRPYAVVIHVTYFDNEDTLRIHHFVSDTNDDSSDTPRKFYEALSKLVEWQDQEDIHSYGLDEFRAYYESQSYPGLGTLKKLSVMHHIEIVSKYLSEHG